MKKKGRTALRLQRYKNRYEEGSRGQSFVLLVDRTGSAEIYALSKKIGLRTRTICVWRGGEMFDLFYFTIFYLVFAFVCVRVCVFKVRFVKKVVLCQDCGGWS